MMAVNVLILFFQGLLLFPTPGTAGAVSWLPYLHFVPHLYPYMYIEYCECPPLIFQQVIYEYLLDIKLWVMNYKRMSLLVASIIWINILYQKKTILLIFSFNLGFSFFISFPFFFGYLSLMLLGK